MKKPYKSVFVTQGDLDALRAAMTDEQRERWLNGSWESDEPRAGDRADFGAGISDTVSAGEPMTCWAAACEIATKIRIGE